MAGAERRETRAGEVWEAVAAGEFDALRDEDDLSPHIPILARIALAHELRPEVRSGRAGGVQEEQTRVWEEMCVCVCVCVCVSLCVPLSPSFYPCLPASPPTPQSLFRFLSFHPPFPCTCPADTNHPDPDP